MDVNARQLMSDTKFFESYSRFIKSESRFETWDDSVNRVMGMHRTKLSAKMKEHPELIEMINEVERAYKEKKILGAQRALQYGGEQLMKHQMKMYNCVSGHMNRPLAFGEYFYILLCGAGAGVSLQKHHIAMLPMIRPRTKQAKAHVIEDSIEGWAMALDVLLSSFFIGGGKHPEYEGRKVYFDYNKIREEGSEISGGFKAPGPEPLQHAINMIERLLTNIAEEGILRPIHVYDILMHTADAVISGGVRRAAVICMFSKDDEEMMNAKTGNWMTENPQRARSNNSAVCLRKELTREEFDLLISKTKQFGEPGFIFVDSLEHTFNPCVEIGMYPYNEKGESGWQGCNLVEGNGSKCNTKEDFFEICRVAAILGTIQATYTDFKFLTPVTKEIFEREALLGVSLTGWMNNPDTLLDDLVLREGASIVKATNQAVAAMLGIRPAARTTCCKPAGNASVLLGTASGVHPEHSKRYLRAMQVNKMQEVAEVLKKTNPYMVEESVWSAGKTDYAISFPVISPKTSLFKKDMSALKMLEYVRKIQLNWVVEGTVYENCVDPTVRHNVSNTIHVYDYEWDGVADFIFKHKEDFTAISLISGNGDKDYHQAPFTEILSEKELVSKYGSAAFFASGLIVDSSKGFSNLWTAIDIASQPEDTEVNQEIKDARSEWIRRFKKFASNHFEGNLKRTGYCLKDVYLLYKWTKIQQNFVEPNLEEQLKKAKEVDINTLGAIACSSGACEI